MSTILYYSNFCEHSKKLLQTISKTNIQSDIHFICIDKRTKENNKMYIVLENGQKIIMPENVNRVPALLLLNKGYDVLYGESILQHLNPRQEVEIKKATNNNMEPMAFSFGGGGFGDVVSDQYSFLDQNSEDLEAKGNGGLRQMHNYVDLNYTDNITLTNEQTEQKKGANRIAESSTQDMMKRIQAERDADLQKLTGNRPPMSF